MDLELPLDKECSEQSKDLFFPSTLSLACLIIFGSLIVISLEILSGFLLTFLIHNIFIIVLIYICVHLYLIRLIIFTCAFPGKNPFVQFFLSYTQAKFSAKDFLSDIINMQSKMNELVSLESISYSNAEGIIISLSTSLIAFKSLYSTYESMKQKYRDIGTYCETFYIQIRSTAEQITQSKLQSIISLNKNNESSITLSQEEKSQIVSINTEVNKLIYLVNEFLFENGFSWNLLNCIRNFFYNDIFWKKEYIRMKTLVDKSYEDVVITSKDGTKIDCVMLKGNDAKANEKNNLMIICGPNLMPLEHMIYSWDLDHLYLSRYTDVLFWNYRGYGLSEGSATLDNVRSDIESVYDYVKALNTWNKIGVHGISVGGVAACHLAKERPVDLLIADRTFGSIERITLSIPCGKALFYLSKLLCIPKVANDENYLNAKCHKILLCDSNDATISRRISLKSCVSQNLIEKIQFDYLNSQHSPYSLLQASNSNNNNNNITNNIIDYALLPDAQESFYKSFEVIYTFMKDYGNNNPRAYNLKRKHSSVVNANDDNANANVNVNSNALNKIENERQCNAFADLFYNRMNNIILSLKSNGEVFASVFEIEGSPKENIRIFMNNFVIWGSPDSGSESNRGNLRLCSNLHVENNYNEFIKLFEMFINQEEIQKYKEYELIEALMSFVDCLKGIEYYIKNIHLERHTNELYELKGDLVTLDCGHNAFYDESEFDTIQYLLAKFFYS